MMEILLAVVALLSLAAVALLVLVLKRVGGDGGAAAAVASVTAQLDGRLQSIERGQERAERALREELAKGREEAAAQAKLLRDEVGSALRSINEAMLKSLTELSTLQANRLDAFSAQLAKVTEASQADAGKMRIEVGNILKSSNDSTLLRLTEITKTQHDHLEAFSLRLNNLTVSNEQKLEQMRVTVEQRLQLLQEDNAKKLEQMRATVDEKLHSTLEKRLGESFKIVSDRLEKVHQGLGEMQTLATGVGDLKRVLTNVKTRGTFGEVQLESLLEQVLAPEQYEKNVATMPGSRDRVEFAIKFPNRDSETNEPIWMPIDSKFPMEDYERLVRSTESADAEGVEASLSALEARVKQCAKDIRNKYLCPPQTTEFGIMFLPTEGLYAEIVRRPGLVESIQRECRVMVAGPTNLAALLTSFQMGFRTLAIQKRSSEVWSLLGVVKTEFGKFGDLLDKVHDKLGQASKTIEDASRKSRTIERKLNKVQELPVDSVEPALLIPAAEDEALS